MISLNSALLHHTPSPDDKSATLIVDVRARAPYTISPLLYGKFCEHLGANINYGMEAQILSNCTFSKWRFSIGDNHRDGGVREETDRAGWNSASRLTPLAWAGQMLGRSSMPTSLGGHMAGSEVGLAEAPAPVCALVPTSAPRRSRPTG